MAKRTSRSKSNGSSKATKEEHFELPSSSDSENEDFNEPAPKKAHRAQQKKGAKSTSQNERSHTVRKDIKPSAEEENKPEISSKSVLYVGNIPNGFHEVEMRRYFSQFGDITRLRLSRNKITANSKHYGYIEFATKRAGQVAAETMNNYLLLGNLLKVEVLPKEKIHPQLFKGANQKFVRLPWNTINQLENDRPKTLEGWKEFEKAVKAKRAEKQAKLKELGINFDLNKLLKSTTA
ncbi:hypothetical protein PP7435_CHR4-0614 [Komagataella phaffii CBS 7435]|uniref:RRM domain-containing protein n=2 Tax=Komagataella phaffii TaxID=460519 RepID=C4R7P8_KOMPG|nr:uncharacterized protein PAS_chr4_0952 [Komagataella phaffii GS115]AOA65039.1 GQ67_04723T0 [Komagataella phaffii]CAH2450995.1 hypothetical protein BQ9382_C4-3225 [Komagataella phaffii CBS 7435]AOA69736.1 GQ68_04695T0 [Komagataella phaffii GS115]CAY71623.1 hypothetical protein PAS_chr4_0952 [Komagataella phaffii GS115]CCA40774.1 hypothetical protein PP7435_CHR4-0614 [Komagataella phaffii CBS 7435]